jgi:hypothetical protein
MAIAMAVALVGGLLLCALMAPEAALQVGGLN